MTGKQWLLLLAACLLAHGAAAQLINHDNSPVCLTLMPECAESCAAPQSYAFVCTAGNGPDGGPYKFCQCAQPVQANPPQQVARLMLSDWPGARACNQKTWLNDCTSQMLAVVNGSTVTFTPGVAGFANEACKPQDGLVIGRGNQAAVSFPQYPIGLTQSGPGILTIDFSQYGAQDPNGMDWSRCVVTYRVVEGSFLQGAGTRAAAGAAGPAAARAGGPASTAAPAPAGARSSGGMATARGAAAVVAAVMAGALAVW